MAILRQKKKLIELLVPQEDCVNPRGKERSVGEPIENFQLLSSGSGSVHTLGSGLNP